MIAGGGKRRHKRRHRKTECVGQMRRLIHRLTKRDVERVIERGPDGFYHDGDGLDLWKRNGNATWNLQVRYGGRRVRFGLGPARMLPLEGARGRAREIRAMIARGQDPLAVRKRAARSCRHLPRRRPSGCREGRQRAPQPARHRGLDANVARRKIERRDDSGQLLRPPL
jgi:hypothetical protein